jgi:hypothetical protein
MTIATNGNELDLDALDAVCGGFNMFGVQIHASAEHMGVSVSIEGVGGIAVSKGGVAVKDAKGNVSSAPWPK